LSIRDVTAYWMPRLKRGMTVRERDSAFPRRDASEVLQEPCPSENRGRRESRVPGAPAAPCATKKHRGRSHRFAGTPGLPCAMVLTGSFVLSPVTGLGCHRHRRNFFRQLDASVGASGPHDFAVRLSAVRQRHRHVHRIPPRVRDDRETPLYRDGTAVDLKVIWVRREQKYFCERGWT
jgi:hypothetical protein